MKTEYLCIGTQQKDLIVDDMTTIKRYNYKYLGINISHNEKLDKAIRERNTACRKAIAILNGIYGTNPSAEKIKREEDISVSIDRGYIPLKQCHNSKKNKNGFIAPTV